MCTVGRSVLFIWVNKFTLLCCVPFSTPTPFPACVFAFQQTFLVCPSLASPRTSPPARSLPSPPTTPSPLPASPLPRQAGFPCQPACHGFLQGSGDCPTAVLGRPAISPLLFSTSLSVSASTVIVFSGCVCLCFCVSVSVSLLRVMLSATAYAQ